MIRSIIHEKTPEIPDSMPPDWFFNFLPRPGSRARDVFGLRVWYRNTDIPNSADIMEDIRHLHVGNGDVSLLGIPRHSLDKPKRLIARLLHTESQS